MGISGNPVWLAAPTLMGKSMDKALTEPRCFCQALIGVAS